MPTPTIDLLEEMLTAGGECKCESPHTESTCSHEVAHIYKTCLWEIMVCENAALCLINGGGTGAFARRFRVGCSSCYRPAHLCWILTPI